MSMKSKVHRLQSKDLLVNSTDSGKLFDKSSNVCVKCRNRLKESVTLKDCDHQFCLACFNTFCRHLDRYFCDVCKKPNSYNQLHSKTSDFLPPTNMVSVLRVLIKFQFQFKVKTGKYFNEIILFVA